MYICSRNFLIAFCSTKSLGSSLLNRGISLLSKGNSLYRKGRPLIINGCSLYYAGCSRIVKGNSRYYKGCSLIIKGSSQKDKGNSMKGACCKIIITCNEIKMYNNRIESSYIKLKMKTQMMEIISYKMIN